MEIWIVILFLIIFFYMIWLNSPEGKSYLAKFEKERKFYRLDKILQPLIENPDDIAYANSIPSSLEKGKLYHRYSYGEAYNIVLDILASNPDKIHIKTLCLELGRRHYSDLRPDKKLTIYDEQAIQNDIQFRSK